jgi:hypothetical protein
MRKSFSDAPCDPELITNADFTVHKQFSFMIPVLNSKKGRKSMWRLLVYPTTFTVPIIHGCKIHK